MHFEMVANQCHYCIYISRNSPIFLIHLVYFSRGQFFWVNSLQINPICKVKTMSLIMPRHISGHWQNKFRQLFLLMAHPAAVHVHISENRTIFECVPTDLLVYLDTVGSLFLSDLYSSDNSQSHFRSFFV